MKKKEHNDKKGIVKQDTKDGPNTTALRLLLEAEAKECKEDGKVLCWSCVVWGKVYPRL